MNKKCFVVMPYLSELHFFYLFMKQYIEGKGNIKVERADDKVLTIPLLDKIKSQILDADLIIADITGRNANVMYELGIARAHAKKVILITKDEIEQAPTDIKHYEFIRYELDKDVDFLDKLDNALCNALIEDVKWFYEKGILLLKTCNKETGSNNIPTNLEKFQERFSRLERIQDLPSKENEKELKPFLLPIIIDNSSDFSVMELIVEWVRT